MAETGFRIKEQSQTKQNNTQGQNILKKQFYSDMIAFMTILFLFLARGGIFIFKEEPQVVFLKQINLLLIKKRKMTFWVFLI